MTRPVSSESGSDAVRNERPGQTLHCRLGDGKAIPRPFVRKGRLAPVPEEASMGDGARPLSEQR